jgi:hypothetical protein
VGRAIISEIFTEIAGIGPVGGTATILGDQAENAN